MSPAPHAPGAENAIHSPYLPQQAGPPGPEGPAGPSKLTAGLIAEIEAQLWKLLNSEKLEKIKKIIGDKGLEIIGAAIKEAKTVIVRSYPGNEIAKLAVGDTSGSFTGPFTFITELKVNGALTTLLGLKLFQLIFPFLSRTEAATTLGVVALSNEARSTVRLKAEAAAFTVGGIATAPEVTDGTIRIIVNVGTSLITFAHEVTEVETELGFKEAVEAKNRLLLTKAANIVLAKNDSCMFIWDSTTERWRNVDEKYTAEGALELNGRSFIVKALGITTAMLGEAVVTAIKLAENAVTTAKIIGEAVTKEKLAKAVQEELLTVAAFPGLSAYTSAKEETETKPTFITMLITYKAEAVAGKVKLVIDGKEIVLQRLGTTTAIKEQITFLVKKGGKWKATLEGSVEKMEIARQIINSV